MKKIILFFSFVFLVSCYNQERKCSEFRTGKFKFEHQIGDEKKVTFFQRNDSIEIENFQGKIDSSHVRWINDCEYILHKINPKNKHEQKGVHIKILTTKENTYTFEFGMVGENSKQKGVITKVE